MRAMWGALGLVGILLATTSPAFAQKKKWAGEGITQIVYDENSVPHIFGTTDAAAFYGLGYQQMMDLPIGTLNMLWLHSGRMAEIAGETYVDEDRVVRMWNVPGIARRHLRSMRDDKQLELLEAYVAGIEAGRKWWRKDNDPALSSRIDKLIGTNGEVNIDPVPDYLNFAFSPYGVPSDPTLPTSVRRVVNRLFDVNHPVTVEHVARLGVCLNSFFLLRSNAYTFHALPPEGQTPPGPANDPRPFEAYGVTIGNQGVKASNGWLLSPGNLLNGGVLTMSDSHIPLSRLHLRPYIVQIKGDRYSATGVTAPGLPAVYSGFNEDLSWLFTAPRGDPVAHNAWEVTLESSANIEDLKFQFETDQGNALINLIKKEATIPYYDPLTNTMSSVTKDHYFVPKHSSEPKIGIAGYPVIPQTADVPVPGAVIQFEQAAFSVAGSPWQCMYRLGRARNATTDIDAIMQDDLLIFGNGNTLLIGDSQGHFRFEFMARIPRQGDGVPASMYDETALLDGHKLSWRWPRFHAPAELPSIGPADVSGTRETWIANNVSPDLIETFRFDEADLLNYPAYMIPQKSTSTWRQLRAEDLLRDRVPAVVTTNYNEDAGIDVRDTWMHMMWPFYETAAALVPGGISVTTTQFMQWVNDYRSHDENDTPNPDYDFHAHRYSQVAVYASLLRSHYQSDLEVAMGVVPPLPRVPAPAPDQGTFGEEPLHPLYDDPTQFTYANYPSNIDAMAMALETVATLWIEGNGAFGLANQTALDGYTTQIPSDPWADSRFDQDHDPAWAGVIQGDKMTRWGHVNMLVLTPHFLVPPKREYVDNVGGGSNPIEFFKGHVYTALMPSLLDTLPYPPLKIPFFKSQSAHVLPGMGMRDTLFNTENYLMFSDPDPKGYEESTYGWSTEETFSWQPMNFGSQTMYTVYLRPGQRPIARYLLAINGTEITKKDLLGDGKLAHQDRFATANDYSVGNWQNLETRRSALGKAKFTLPYIPLGEVDF